MKILRIEEKEDNSQLEIEPKSNNLLLSVSESGCIEWSSINISKEFAVEIVDYLKEYYNF
jgi:hypothetical protein